jgi:hypothetical protein
MDSRNRRLRLIVITASMLLLGGLGTAVLTAAQSSSYGETVYACIDSRNGALYGLQVDDEDVRCSRGDDQISWPLGHPEPGPSDPGNPDPGHPGSGGSSGISFAGSWQSGISYMEGIVVEHQGSSYVSIAVDSQGVEPPNENYWQLIALRGADGADGERGAPGEDGQDGDRGPRGATGEQGPFGLDGEGLEWRGEFDGSTSYHRNDIVQYEGSAWIATSDDAAGTPGTSANWDLLAQGGSSGEGNGGNDENGGENGPELHRVVFEGSIGGMGSIDSSHGVTCPSDAPRVIAGGYYMANASGESHDESGPVIDGMRRNGPEHDPDGEDRWVVGWSRISNAAPTDVMTIHATCTSD